MIKIGKLIWGEGNIRHIDKHKVRVEEVEEACRLVIKTFKTYKERLIILGKTKENRLLTIVLAPKEKDKYYVVTVRDMSKKERRLIK